MFDLRQARYPRVSSFTSLPRHGQPPYRDNALTSSRAFSGRGGSEKMGEKQFQRR
jgi:hypothetical protein